MVHVFSANLKMYFKLLMLLVLVKASELISFEPFKYFGYYVEKNVTVSSSFEAEKYCKNKQAQLVVVNTQEIKNFIVKKIGEVLGEYTTGKF